MLDFNRTKKYPYASMASGYVFACLAQAIRKYFKTPLSENQLYLNLAKLTALAVENRYGVEYKKNLDLVKIKPIIDEHSIYAIKDGLPELYQAAFAYTLSVLLDRYGCEEVSDTELIQTELLLNKLVNKYKNVYKNKEIYFINNFIYCHDDDSFEKQSIENELCKINFYTKI